ncbi:TnsA endonuclease N-terminal domain-containing protein [Paraburkholderia strydomiana]
MARGIRKWSEKLIEQRLRQGYGEGEGAAYKPWVSTSDFSSLGQTHRAYSAKFERTIELVSDVEWNTFVLAEFSGAVSQVYEGFPIPRDDSLQIAGELGIKHPFYPGTSVPTVMTVDFLTVMGSPDDPRLVAIDCKRSEAAEDERAIEKLQITRAYFAGCGVPHHLVFHSAIPMQKVRNVEWFRGAIWKPGQVEPTLEHLQEASALMLFELAGSQRATSLAEYCASFEQRHGLVSGMGLRVARILLWDHKLRCNLDTARLESQPLSSFQCERPSQPFSKASGL